MPPEDIVIEYVDGQHPQVLEQVDIGSEEDEGPVPVWVNISVIITSLSCCNILNELTQYYFAMELDLLIITIGQVC